MKNYIFVVTIILFLLGLVTYGFTAGEKEESAKEISYIHLGDWAKPILEEAAEDFKATTGVTVTMQFWPWDGAHDKYVTLIESGALADCGQGFQEWLGEFHERGAIVPTEDYISNNFKSQIMDSARENLIYKGELYATPFITSIRCLLYRKDVFDEAGIAEPKNFNDILSAAKKLHSPPEMHGYALCAGRNKFTTQFFLYIFWPYGGKLLNEDGTKVAFNSPEGIAALKMFKELSKYAPEGYINSDGQLMENIFTSGNLAMQIEGPWVYNQLLENVPDAELKVVPSIEGPEGKKGNLYVVDALYLFNEKKASTSQKWFEFYKLDEKYLGKAYNDFGLIPDMKYHMDWEFMQKNKLVQLYAPAVEYGISRPMIPEWSKIEDALNVAIQKVCLGELTAEEALKEAEQTANNALNQ
jgi:multiple sugar transport system substrate-binding protein